jgi:ParB family chromosome partitioning protein
MQNQDTKTPYVPRIKPVESTSKVKKVAESLKQAKDAIAEKTSSSVKKIIESVVEIKPTEQAIHLIPCDQLKFDQNQPFRMYTEEELDDLAARIKQSGLLNPIIVRKNSQGACEILSGRNRAKAVMKLGHKEIEAFVYEADDDEAKLIMLNANLGQRENLLPSEKAKAYKMEAEILNRQGQHSTSGNNCQKKDTRQMMSEKHKESGRSIANYIRLASLIPEFLALLDEKKLTIVAGLEISFLQEWQQRALFKNQISKGVRPTKQQLAEMKRFSQERRLNEDMIAKIIREVTPEKRTKKEYIKFDKSKFSQFTEIINNTKDLERCFIDFLHAQRHKMGCGSHVAK